MNIPSISPEEAKRCLGSGEEYVYLDVRTVPEFHQGHAPGALNIPVAEVNASTGRMEGNPRFLDVVRLNIPREANVIVGRRTGGRSEAAVQLMMGAGYTNALNMTGGFAGISDGTGQIITEGWSTLGYPIERGEGGDRAYAALQRKSATP